MDVDLTGNVALVTGAARGIGLVVAEDLASEGVNVCGADVRADLLQDEMQRITEQHGVETLAVAADVGVEKQVVEMVGQVFSKWSHIDILINNAGIRQICKYSMQRLLLCIRVLWSRIILIRNYCHSMQC